MIGVAAGGGGFRGVRVWRRRRRRREDEEDEEERQGRG